ncbi:MAG: FAD-binding oxidoreductase [Chloroflexi bacterium]|nr:FAD-binding oxidoreductase [Chloroflexota bacterium]
MGTTARRSIWAWGLESEEPSKADRKAEAKRMAEEYGTVVDPPPLPTIDRVDIRAPRIQAPDALATICSHDKHDRAAHAYGRSYPDKLRAFQGDFRNAPDLVAYPSSEAEVTAVLEWCSDNGYAAIPYGGGSSVVDGVNPPEGYDGIVTIDLTRLDQVLEIDESSRAARIQAGVLGPALEAQLKPHGYTLRHFPQSFEFSSLGGWIVTRSGGHYATNHTHIDDFVESVRMVTPRGVWESRRLPGSGAGPSPDRLVIGSEGILGIVTEAWMRIQKRPRFRASAGVRFPDWAAGYEGTRQVVQAKLWPANLRLLDPAEAQKGSGLDGKQSLLIIGFESAEVPQGAFIQEAVAIARAAGGQIDDDAIVVDDGTGKPTGRGGNVGAWRDWFIRAPYAKNTQVGLGLIADTFETAITWDRFPEFDAAVRTAMTDILQRVCGGGEIACRFTHVYPDGPAPYYTYAGFGTPGAELEQWNMIKAAGSDAVMNAGGTITHHHAVGRMHRPWYDAQRPDLFAGALREAKRSLDPNGVLNPGVLIDP